MPTSLECGSLLPLSRPIPRCATRSSGGLPPPPTTAPNHSPVVSPTHPALSSGRIFNPGALDDRRHPFPPQLLAHLRAISSRRNCRAPPAAPEPIGCATKQTDAPGPHPPQLQRKSLRPVAQGPRSPRRLRPHLQPLPRRSLSRSNHLPRAKIQPEARKHHPRLRLY